MQKANFFILWFISCIFVLPISAQDPKNQQLSDFIQRVLKTIPIVPAVSISVTNDSQTLYAQGFGMADREENIKADAQTNFYIASTTKAFSGLLAVILAEEGKLNLDAQITDYKPFKDFKTQDIFKNITVRDLLSHQSGIENEYLSLKLAYSGDYTLENILSLVENETVRNEAGKAFEYTNFGYYLLSFIIESEFGTNWKDLMAEKIFSPLKMQNTSAYLTKAQEVTFAKPYLGVFPEKLKKSYVQKTNKTTHAAGGLFTNAEDIARFLRFYLQNGKLDGTQIYAESLVKKSYQKQVSADHKYVKIFDGKGYALGWRTGQFNDNQVVYHFGGYSGFYAHVSFLPEKKLGVSVLANHGLAQPVADLIAAYAYDLHLGKTKNLKKHERFLRKKLPKILHREQQDWQEFQAKIAGRTWQMSLPFEKYAGKFHHEKVGTVEIIAENESLTFHYGQLKTVATPFPTADCVRIELVPNSGIVACFNIENQEVRSVYMSGETFVKVN